MRVLASLSAMLTIAIAAAAGGATDPAGFDHSRLDGILREVVRGESVDYPLVGREFVAGLDLYLASADKADISSLSRDERLAFYINVYNAAVIRSVARRFRTGYSASDESFKLFDEPLVSLGGERISLNRLEHEIIRPRFQDPRIHAALVCAARSCPPILARAYRADELDEVLEANMRRFVRDPTRNTVDSKSRRLELSKIFEWYAEDFGGTDGIVGYVGRFLDRDVTGFALSFTEYSWELNLARDPSPLPTPPEPAAPGGRPL